MSLLVPFAALLLAACQKPRPTGQVIAVVNGQEVTVAELNEEARVRGLNIGADAVLRNSLLQDVIDRKLMVGAALQQKLDQTPEYLLAVRRDKELVLARQLIARGQVSQPSADDITSVMQANPAMFDQRMLLTIDEIRFPPVDRQMMARITRQPSVDAVAAELRAARVKAARVQETLDTATLDRATADQLLGVRNGGSIIVFNQAGRVVAGRVVSQVPIQVSAEERDRFARQLIADRIARQSAQELVAPEREKARIVYQSGFGPAKSP